jgi:hypothetical protein
MCKSGHNFWTKLAMNLILISNHSLVQDLSIWVYYSDVSGFDREISIFAHKLAPKLLYLKVMQIWSGSTSDN